MARRLAGLGIAYLHGAAPLRPDGVVLVTLPDGSEREVRGRAVLVATGSRPAHPPGIPFDDPDVYDTDRIFTLGRLPTHAVIAMGGTIELLLTLSLNMPTYTAAYDDAAIDGLAGLVEQMEIDLKASAPVARPA